MVKSGKAAVIGCGFVGSSIAFNLMIRGLFNELVLIDVNHDKANGEAMDLNHGIAYTRPSKIYAGSYDDLSDCFMVIITAGANQRPDETRLDLVNKNTAILKSIIPEIVKRNRECIILVVSNPVDILTYVALKLSGLPSNQVIGSGTVLDSGRLKYLLGQHLNVDSRNVHSFIIGEHGDSELAVWSSANISGISLWSFCEECGKCNRHREMDNIFQQVKNSGYHIIEAKGATYYGISLAVMKICEVIVRNEKSVLPVSSLVQGHYGLHDVCIGLPSVLGSHGVERILEIPLNDDEMQRLHSSAATLKKVIEGLNIG